MGFFFSSKFKGLWKVLQRRKIKILLDPQEKHLSQIHKVNDNFLGLVISKKRHPEEILKYEYEKVKVKEGSKSPLKFQKLKDESFIQEIKGNLYGQNRGCKKETE